MDDTNTNPEIVYDISEIVLSNQISQEVSEEVSEEVPHELYADEDMQKYMDNLDEENAKLYWINSKTIGVSESWNQNMKETNISTNYNDDDDFITNIPEYSDSGNITISKEAIYKDIPQINIPKLIFIVPYRNREEHLDYFKNHMKTILEDLSTDTYAIYYVHQCDDRGFNRGAMKNIGFLMVKNKYPNDYKNITLVFNDVDSMPAKKIY